MYYYGNSYGYGNNCCGQQAPYVVSGGCGGGCGGFGGGYAIILVLFILLIIILGTRNWI